SVVRVPLITPGCEPVKLIENGALCWAARVNGGAKSKGPWNPDPATVSMETLIGVAATFCKVKAHTRNCPTCTCPKLIEPEKAAPELAMVPEHPGSTVSTGAGEEVARR